MSRPEETLEQLARLAREDEALEAELPAELRAPLSRERTSALVDGIQARLATQAAAGAPPAARSLSSSAPARASRRRFVLSTAGGAVALAAGVLLWVGRPVHDEAPLPPYEVEIEGEQRTERSTAPTLGSLRLRPGSTLRFEARPRTDFNDGVRARVLLMRSGLEARGNASELELNQEQSSAGALKIEVRLPEALPESGELVLVVERASRAEDAQRFAWNFERAP